MNAENLRTLAHELRADPDSYRQSVYAKQEPCGTVGCIAGHAVALASGESMDDVLQLLRDDDTGESVREAAAVWLGLSDDAAARLFDGSPYFNPDWPDEGWPEEFSERFYQSKKGSRVESPAFVAADLLDALADGKVTL